MSSSQYCPVAKAMELLDERWTMLVIRELLAGSRHFSELRRGVAAAVSGRRGFQPRLRRESADSPTSASGGTPLPEWSGEQPLIQETEEYSFGLGVLPLGERNDNSISSEEQR